VEFNGFSKEGLDFLDELVIHNSKEWFDDNRERYERFIVEPSKAYVEEMGEHLQVLVPRIKAIPKVNQSLFKIYRDARYHPLDPIKERIGIIFWQGGGHRMQSASFYMHYDAHEVFVATGIRNFKPPLLNAYRAYIKDIKKREELHGILEDLQRKGYLLPEAHYKRLPMGFEKEDAYSYLAKYKAMYLFKTYVPNETFTSKEVIDVNFTLYKDMLPLHQWVYELTLSQ
jgi:uncharacterized protein (TIGR02453 family)